MNGDQADMVRRLRSVLPGRWFPDEAPVLDAVLSGFAAAWSWLHGLLAWVGRQGRLSTSDGVMLDILSRDYFGDRLPRLRGEPDERFRARIRRELLRERATRKALRETLVDITGNEPVIVEPANTGDCGCWSTGGFAWGEAGYLGSLDYPHQAFVTAYRPVGQGVRHLAGWGTAEAGWSDGAWAYYSSEMLAEAIGDDDIARAVAAVIPAGTVIWLAITELPNPEARLDSFVLDVSRLS